MSLSKTEMETQNTEQESTVNTEDPAREFDGTIVEYTSFDDMNLKLKLLRGIYAYGWEKPSTIQQKAIMPLISGRDMIVQAQSGTGKTATYLLLCTRIVPDMKLCGVAGNRNILWALEYVSDHDETLRIFTQFHLSLVLIEMVSVQNQAAGSDNSNRTTTVLHLLIPLYKLTTVERHRARSVDHSNLRRRSPEATIHKFDGSSVVFRYHDLRGFNFRVR